MEKLRFDTFYAVQQRVLAAGGTSTDIQTLTELCHLHELTQMHDEIGCFVLTSLRSLAASITSSVNTVARSIRRLTEIGVIQFISERGFSSRAYLTFLDSVDYGTEVFDCKNFRKCSERELIAVLKNRATYNHAERMEAAKVLCDGIVSRDQYLAGRITESHIEKVALSLANKDCTTLRRAVAYAKKSLYDSVVVLKEEELSLRITTNNRMQQSKKNDEEERIVVSEEEAEKLGISYPQFRRLFRNRFSRPPYQFVLDCRFQRSASLILQTDLQIREIAAQCGFSDTASFVQQFRKRYSFSPLKYRQSRQNELSAAAVSSAPSRVRISRRPDGTTR